MSLNKVLNRPLFREQALKKGALKPIKARIGQMIGPVMNVTSPLNPRTPVPAIRPNIFKRAAGDIRSFVQRPGQFFSPRTGRFVPGAGTAAFLGVEGLAPIIGAGRRKLGIADSSPYSGLIRLWYWWFINFNSYG